VAVNGSPVTEPGFRVGPDDRVTYMGSPVVLPDAVTAMLNKPLGYETTMSDGGRRPVSLLMTGLPHGTVPVGRLDINTGGLLLLSNDGDLVHRLTHPSWEIEREYSLTLDSSPSGAAIAMMRKGVRIGARQYSRPLSVSVSGRTVRLVLTTGRNREVRRLAEKCGFRLQHLERIRYGPVRLGDLPRGKWRMLSESELASLMKAAGMGPS